MSGGIDTGYGDHIGDADEMVGRKLEMIQRLRDSNYQPAYRFWESKDMTPATDDAGDQPDAERSVRG